MSEAVSAGAPVMVIAGGSGSIGRELAAQAAQAGWRVALHGRRVESLAAAEALVLAHAPGATISLHPRDFGGSDAASAKAIMTMIADVAAAHGRIDALVDCSTGGPAGIAGMFSETDPGAYTGFAGQSVVVFQRLAHATLPLLAQGGGALLAVVSDAGIFAAPRQSMIGTMRAATIGFVRNLALEVARDGVRVNAISPSYVEGTDIAQRLETASASRMERARARAGLGLPDAGDVAALALFLCGAQSRRITGQVVSINGGLNA